MCCAPCSKRSQKPRVLSTASDKGISLEHSRPSNHDRSCRPASSILGTQEGTEPAVAIRGKVPEARYRKVKQIQHGNAVKQQAFDTKLRRLAFRVTGTSRQEKTGTEDGSSSSRKKLRRRTKDPPVTITSRKLRAGLTPLVHTKFVHGFVQIYQRPARTNRPSNQHPTNSNKENVGHLTTVHIDENVYNGT